MLGQHGMSDSCLIVEDLAVSMRFYRDVLGFGLRRHAPGFADFVNRGSTLAMWERGHLLEHVGIDSPRGCGRGSMQAVEVGSAEEVEELYRELLGRGVVFLVGPKWYGWNAYACYFEDPDQHLWEIYAWGAEGHAGLLEIAPTDASSPPRKDGLG